MRTLYNYLFNLATKLGAKECTHCGTLDVAFGLGPKDVYQVGQVEGHCLKCKKQVQKYSKLKTFYYSLLVYKNILLNYNDFINQDDKENAKEIFEELIQYIVKNQALPTDEKILEFQAFHKQISDEFGGYPVGSKKLLGGNYLIVDNMVQVDIDYDNIKYTEELRAIATGCFAMNYLLNFEVSNEVTI